MAGILGVLTGMLAMSSSFSSNSAFVIFATFNASGLFAWHSGRGWTSHRFGPKSLLGRVSRVIRPTWPTAGSSGDRLAVLRSFCANRL
jgi:hypothetical protein